MSLIVPVMTPQNFTLPAGYNEVIMFSVNPIVASSLLDVIIWWRVYEQVFGLPVTGLPPIIEKSGLGIDSPLSFTVQLETADTIDLLRNYYHEASIIDAANQVIGGLFGIMTVTATLNRESGQ